MSRIDIDFSVRIFVSDCGEGSYNKPVNRKREEYPCYLFARRVV